MPIYRNASRVTMVRVVFPPPKATAPYVLWFYDNQLGVVEHIVCKSITQACHEVSSRFAVLPGWLEGQLRKVQAERTTTQAPAYVAAAFVPGKSPFVMGMTPKATKARPTRNGPKRRP